MVAMLAARRLPWHVEMAAVAAERLRRTAALMGATVGQLETSEH
jgi:hypothetical protein